MDLTHQAEFLQAGIEKWAVEINRSVHLQWSLKVRTAKYFEKQRWKCSYRLGPAVA